MKRYTILAKKSGRSHGTITVRHQGGREKRFLRLIDWKRGKSGVVAKVVSIDYDPNRSANIAELLYPDGQRSFILAPAGLTLGANVVSGPLSPLETGNCLPIGKIPVGTLVHALEVMPGKGAQIVKSAGSAAVVHGKEEKWVLVKLPSGEVRRFDPAAIATIGQVGNEDFRNRVLGKAGVKRHMGIRPTVRGTAQDPRTHPHGGGEGRSGVGMKYPKTPYGRRAVGNTRKRNKYSDKLIVVSRKGIHG